ncbi:unnamed protein product [Rotaria sp. Silwood2]|nr:unnamed protein product [Rotaria sp. Silwood2]CAF4476771.1 unnamed protein product [Rotaria sp. Silwood2]
MKDNTHRMDEKLDRINDKIDQTAIDTELHHETRIKLMPTLVSIVGDFIWPVMNHNVAGLREKQPQLQKIFNNLEVLLSHLKSDYTARRKRSTSPPPRLAPSQQSSKASNNTQNNESDQFLPKYPDVWKSAKIVTLNKLKAGVLRCDQTRLISLLATHSKLFEKIMLDKVRHWAETNKLVPVEQSDFRSCCLLPTRVLSIYQEVKNNLTANIPTLAVFVDYQKAHDKVWHKGLAVKLNRLGIPLALLKLIISWLNDRRAYVNFEENKSKIIYMHLGLPQGSSLSPYLFTVYHCDLIACLGAHSSHIFADDLNVLISPPIYREMKPMIKFLEEEGTKICNKIADYSKR